MIFYALLIFVLRVLEYGLETQRIKLISRNKKFAAPLVAFVEILLWYFVFRFSMSYPGNFWIGAFAYAAGASVGTFFGLTTNREK